MSSFSIGVERAQDEIKGGLASTLVDGVVEDDGYMAADTIVDLFDTTVKLPISQ